jgi:hypothetical protein
VQRFGRHSIHQQLTLSQLLELEKAVPALSKDLQFVLAVLRKNQPAEPIDQLDAKAKAEFYAVSRLASVVAWSGRECGLIWGAAVVLRSAACNGCVVFVGVCAEARSAVQLAEGQYHAECADF